MISVTRAGCWWIVLAAVHCSIPGTLLPAQVSPFRTIHVFVALADNEHQGIVPVPARLGNGLDPAHNLYWGAAAGVRHFFSQQRLVHASVLGEAEDSGS